MLSDPGFPDVRAPRQRGPARGRSGVIAIEDLTDADLQAWRDLAGRSAEPNPFFEPECVLPAARRLGGTGLGVLVVSDRDGDWLACLPVTSRLKRWHMDLPVLSGWRHLYGYLGTPLVARSDLEHATERLVTRVLRASRTGIVALPWLAENGPVAAAVRRAANASGHAPALHRSFSRAVLRQDGVVAGTAVTLSSRHRRDLRRLSRRLADVLGEPPELRDVTEQSGAIDAFMAVEASGWKGAAGTALGANARHAAYFRELCEGFRAAGRLQLMAFGTPSQWVSCKCNLLAADTVFYFKIAHDEAFAHYRPGLQLELRMLDYFRDEMAQTVIDSCAAADSKLFEHFWLERQPIGSYVLTSDDALRWTIGHTVGRSRERANHHG